MPGPTHRVSKTAAAKCQPICSSCRLLHARLMCSLLLLSAKKPNRHYALTAATHSCSALKCARLKQTGDCVVQLDSTCSSAADCTKRIWMACNTGGCLQQLQQPVSQPFSTELCASTALNMQPLWSRAVLWFTPHGVTSSKAQQTMQPGKAGCGAILEPAD